MLKKWTTLLLLHPFAKAGNDFLLAFPTSVASFDFFLKLLCCVVCYLIWGCLPLPFLFSGYVGLDTHSLFSLYLFFLEVNKKVWNFYKATSQIFWELSKFSPSYYKNVCCIPKKSPGMSSCIQLSLTLRVICQLGFQSSSKGNHFWLLPSVTGLYR